MGSPNRLAANRQNAKRSTGPRTKAGKQAVARNALRHGLAQSIQVIPELGPLIARLTQLIAGPTASSHRMQLAQDVAEAEVQLARVRRARLPLFQAADAEPPEYFDGSVLKLFAKEFQRMPTNVSIESILPTRGEWIARNMMSVLRSLEPLHRYERRAMSRRKFAIRALDALDEPVVPE